MTSVGLFERRAAAIAYAAMVVGSGTAAALRCARWPNDGSPFWMIAELDVALGAHFVELAGGQPYSARRDGTVTRLRGHVDRFPGLRLPSLDELVRAPEVPIATLVLACPPIPTEPADRCELMVFGTGRAARYAVRRCLDTGVAVGVTAVTMRPSGGEGGGIHALRIRLDGGQLPGPLVTTVANLPDTIVAVATDANKRLLVQYGFRLPVPPGRVAALVPTDECWMITADTGGWQIETHGAEVAATALLHVDPPPPARLDHAAVPDLTHVRQEVRLERTNRLDGRTDAVLVDDDELDPLRRFIATRPIAETAHIVFGPGRHLLVAPQPLLDAVPVGVPVRRIGPRGLFLESNALLRPPVPAGAREQLFEVRPDRLVVLCHSGLYRLDLANLRPAWSLWLGPKPTVEHDLSPAAVTILERFTAADLTTGGPTAPDQPVPGLDLGPELGGSPAASADRATLLQQAAEHLAVGRLAAAADLLEQAGEYGRAANLFRLAALAPAVDGDGTDRRGGADVPD